MFGYCRRRETQEFHELTDAELSVSESSERANPERMIDRFTDPCRGFDSAVPSP